MLPNNEQPRCEAVRKFSVGGQSAIRRGLSRLAAHYNDTAFMSETRAAALEGPKFYSHWIFWIAAAFFVFATAWAAYASLDEITVGEGKVIPSSQVQVVQNLEGGIVSAILVGVGQKVDKDQVLIRIDPTRFTSSYGESKAKEQALRAKVARLAAESSNAPFSVHESLVTQNPELVAHERSLYASRQKELNANSAILRHQADQKTQELAEMRARQQKLRQSLALVNQELVMMRPLAKQGVVSDVEVLRLERQANDLDGERDAATLAIPRLEAAIKEAHHKIGEIDQRFRTEAANELSQARGDLAALSASSPALEDRVSRTVVRSPVAGIVKQIKIATVGGVVQPGMDLLEIVPLEDSLLIEARVRPADIAFLRPGQDATIKLTAYDFTIYGGFPAALEYISADTVTNDKGESFYLIRARTNGDALGPQKKSLPVIPGMVATVDILTGRKTVLEYLLKPILKAKAVALRER